MKVQKLQKVERTNANIVNICKWMKKAHYGKVLPQKANTKILGQPERHKMKISIKRQIYEDLDINQIEKHEISTVQ